MVSFKQLAVLVVILVVVSLAWVYYQSGSRQISSTQNAQNYVLEDLKSDAAFAGQNVSFVVYSIAQNSSTDQWNAIAKISVNPHSACPTVYIRDYWLLPIHYDQKFVTGNCQTTGVISFPEEAIVDSKSVPQVVPMLDSSPYACGFVLPLDSQAATEAYCPSVNYASVQNFISTLPQGAGWVTSWQVGNSTVYVGLDRSGNAVATGAA